MDLLQYKLLAGVEVKTFFSDYTGSNEYEGEFASHARPCTLIAADMNVIVPCRSLALLSWPVSQHCR